MVFPGLQRIQRRKVGVGVHARFGRPSHALDVDADNVSANLSHSCATDSIFGNAKDPQDAIEEPDSKNGVEPQLIAPLAGEEQFEVVPRADQDKDGQYDMGNEENLI